MKKQKLDKRTKLEKEIDNVLECMKLIAPDTDDYKVASENLERLYKLKLMEKSGKKISPDTIAVVAGNLLGIGIIIGYEKANVITTKALGFVLKGRV